RIFTYTHSTGVKIPEAMWASLALWQKPQTATRARLDPDGRGCVLIILLMLHHNFGAERDTRVKIDHIVVDQPEAPRRHRLSNSLRRIGAVDPVNRPTEVHRARTK